MPFARSCVAKLKKLGLPYANQSFEIDGVSIKVRIEPGHEFIRIEGSNPASLYMDSGIIDVLTQKLAWSSNVQAYNVGFTEVITSGPYSGWLKHPVVLPPSPKQVAGEIQVPAKRADPIQGSKLKPDAQSARSFSNGYELNNSITPAAWVEVEDDPVAVGKVAAAVICPASVFTGRCRQYVQALYGAPVFNPVLDADGEVSGGKYSSATILPGSSPGDGGIPRLTVNSVLIDSGSGVVEDEYGKLYLVRLLSDHRVMILPMKESGSAAALRKRYKDKDPTKRAPISAEDLKRVNSYIMSQSVPTESFVGTGSITTGGETTHCGLTGLTKIGATPPETNVYWMGYSWHWMYQQNKASCVASKASPLGDQYVMTSKITIEITCTSTPCEGGAGYSNAWGVAVEAAEEWKSWRLDRLHWCLAEPDWRNGGMTKTFPPSGNFLLDLAPVTDALFYLFYKENDEEVRCTVTVNKTKAIADKREFYPPYARDGLYPADTSLLTCGYEDGWQTDKTDGAKNVDGGMAGDGSLTPDNAYYWSAVFKVGDVTSVPLEVRHIEAGSRIDIKNKVMPSDPPAGQYTRALYSNYLFNLPQTIDAGRPDPLPFGPVQTVSFIGVAEQDTHVGMTYDKETSSIRDEWSSTATMVTPIGDSEAIYFQTEGVHSHARTDRLVRHYSTLANSYLMASRFTRGDETVGGQTMGNPDGSTYVIPAVHYGPYTGPWYYAERSRYCGSENGDVETGQSTPDAINIGTPYGVHDLLITKIGAINAAIPNLNLFHDESVDEVGAIIKSFSGVTSNSPVLTWIEGAGSGAGSYAGSAYPVITGYT